LIPITTHAFPSLADLYDRLHSIGWIHPFSAAEALVTRQETGRFTGGTHDQMQLEAEAWDRFFLFTRRSASVSLLPSGLPCENRAFQTTQ